MVKHIANFHSCRHCRFQGNSSELEVHYHSHSNKQRQIGRGRYETHINYDINPFEVVIDFDGETSIYDHGNVQFTLLDDYFDFIQGSIKNVLLKSFQEHSMFKLTPHLKCTFARKIHLEEPERFKTHELGYLQILLHPDSVEDSISNMRENFRIQIGKFERNGSGYLLEKITGLQLRVGAYSMIRGACFIPTPKIIKNSKAVVNVHNVSNMPQ